MVAVCFTAPQMAVRVVLPADTPVTLPFSYEATAGVPVVTWRSEALVAFSGKVVMFTEMLWSLNISMLLGLISICSTGMFFSLLLQEVKARAAIRAAVKVLSDAFKELRANKTMFIVIAFSFRGANLRILGLWFAKKSSFKVGE